jgi:hypothetical protein
MAARIAGLIHRERWCDCTALPSPRQPIPRIGLGKDPHLNVDCHSRREHTYASTPRADHQTSDENAGIAQPNRSARLEWLPHWIAGERETSWPHTLW